ncbi:MAG: glycerol-3-phosphate 1-O-acyltransferase [Halioglobus sp.]
MSALSLEDKLQTNPWPASEGHGVLFILDARNSLEEDVLRRWVGQHQPESADKPVIACMDLGDDSKGIDTTELLKRIELPADTVVAPLGITWLPNEEAINSGPRLRDFLMGDPRRPSPKRGQTIIDRAPSRFHLLVGEPDSLENLQGRYRHKYGVDPSSVLQSFSKFVARQATIVLGVSERHLQGGRYKVPRYVAESLQANRGFNEALDTLSAEEGKPKPELMKEAAVYMKEMISVPRTFWLDFYAKFNDFCLGLGYESNIVYDRKEIDELRDVVRDYPSLLLWTHKTYLDGMVVPKVMYENDFPMPHMFGGANLSFAGLGFLIRRSGGIFIRRSFQDNAVYKLTLRHYIGYLMEKRFPMNWAFEGTRSRMGKLMPPRYGLLKYVLEACHTTDARNIHIIPVSISYDLIRDVEEYATEQTGRGKGPESLRWFIGYIRSLARPMGKVYMDIGKPVVLDRAPDPDDKLALSKIAFEVAVEANRVTPITFPSLVTMSLLGAAPKALTEEEVIADLRALLAWAEERNLRISDDFDRAYADQMDGLLGIMIDEGIVTRYDEGPEIVYGVAMAQHPVASYYRNTIIHFFVNKAIIELALLKACETINPDALEVFWAEVDYLRDLFKFEFFYSPTEEFHQQIRDEIDRYGIDWSTLITEGPIGFQKILGSLSPIVCHVTLLTFAEAYSVVADLLAGMDPWESLEEQDCITQALKLGRQAYLQRRISSESSIGKLLFKNGHQMLKHRELTEGGADSRKEERIAMAKELRDVIRRLNLYQAIGVVGRSAA